ncbi:MAG: PfkB family carbohydrate kinase [Anaerolineales bacterium]
MHNIAPLEPVDYLAIGHIAVDLTARGPRIGGSVTYSALTARALGLRVGIVTSWAAEVPSDALQGVPVVNLPAEDSTTFENIYTKQGRLQYLHHVAQTIHLNAIPEAWQSASIVHLAPIAQEVDPSLVRNFPSALIGVTPQGWLRSWDSTKRVRRTEWPEASFVLQRAGAAVISAEDIGMDESRIDELAAASRVLAVTEAASGTRLYWHGDVRRFRPPEVEEVDASGAGDIFAAAFFVRLYTTRDPWEAARFATLLSAYSVSRMGMDSIPTQEEIQEGMVEVL